MRKNKLVRGTVVLMFASLITKGIGFLYSIVLSRTIGAEGIGIIALVMPMIGLTMTLTTLGMPTAVAKLVAETESQGNFGKSKRIVIYALGITLSLSVVVALVILLSGKHIVGLFFADQRAYYPLMAMIPVIPIMAIAGILRGFFQGRQNMTPLAISQVIEGIIRVFLIYMSADYLMHYGLAIAAAGAMFCSVIAEGLSICYLVFNLRRKLHRKYRARDISRFIKKRHQILPALFRIGLPLTGSQLVRSLLRVIQPIVITNSLAYTGITPEIISSQYGMLTGYIMPLLFIPGFVNHSLGVSLVPAISAAHARGDIQLIKYRLKQALRISTIVGLPSAVLLYIFAEPLLRIIYQAPEASQLMRLITPFFFFQYFHTPLQSILIGMGKPNVVLLNNLIPKCVTLALIFPMAYNLGYGIYGVGLALGVGVILETLFHITFLVYAIRGK